MRSLAFLAWAQIAMALAATACQRSGVEPIQPATEHDSSASSPAYDSTSSSLTTFSESSSPERTEAALSTSSGATVRITTDPCTLAPGEKARLLAEVVSTDSGIARSIDGLSFEWRAPDGWKIEGAGAEVHVVAPEEVTPSVEVLLDVSDGESFYMEARARVRMEHRQPVAQERQEATLPSANFIRNVRASPNPVSPGATIEMEIELQPDAPEKVEFVWELATGWDMTPIDGGRRARVTAPEQSGSRAEIVVRVRAETGESMVSIPVSTTE